jgi:type I restriction enzyme R subunit
VERRALTEDHAQEHGRLARDEYVHRQDARAPFLDPFGGIDRHWHNLPHWQQDQAWQFVTWHLGDSLPKAKLAEWFEEREAWLKCHPKPWDSATELAYHQLYSARIDAWLDAGHGSCVLREPPCAEIVADAFRHFAGERYELGAFVVMPNHVHVLFRPINDCALESILHSWKSFTAKAINKVLGRRGTLRQEDYWDRIIRNEEHLAGCLRHIEENPLKAGLRHGEYVEYRSTSFPPAE